MTLEKKIPKPGADRVQRQPDTKPKADVENNRPTLAQFT